MYILGTNLQHNDANSKSTLRLHTICPDRFIFYYIAALGDVPRGAMVLALGIDGIRRGLNVDGHGPESEKREV